MDTRAVLRATLQATAFFLAGIVIPVIGQAVILFTPVPFILAAVRHGLASGAAAIIIASVAAFALIGPLSGAVMLIAFGIMAFALALGILQEKRPERVVLFGAFLPILCGGVVAAVLILERGLNPVAAVGSYVRDGIQDAITIYGSMGLTDLAAEVQGRADDLTQTFLRLLPGVTAAFSLLQAACCYGIARLLLLRDAGSGPDLRRQPTLALWHAPDQWVWGLIAALACIAVPQQTVRFIGINFAVVFVILYTVQGIAVAEHLLLRAKVHAAVRSILYAVLLALPTAFFFVILGVIDIWTDARKLRLPVKPSGQE